MFSSGPFTPNSPATIASSGPSYGRLCYTIRGIMRRHVDTANPTLRGEGDPPVSEPLIHSVCGAEAVA